MSLPMAQKQAVQKAELTELQRRLIDKYQRGFPLEELPYDRIAAELDVPVADIQSALDHLVDLKVISRIGAVVTPHRAGWSTLAALAVPEERLELVADLVNRFEEVNHNYEREHHFNLWFVVTAPDRESVERVLDSLETLTGLTPLNLPMEEAFHIDLGFDLKWN